MHQSHARIEGNETKQGRLILGKENFRANEAAGHTCEDDYAREEGSPPAHQNSRFDVDPLQVFGGVRIERHVEVNLVSVAVEWG